MFKMFDCFKAYDENKQPYTFTIERHTETANLHAAVENNCFSQKSIGNRFIVNTPRFMTCLFQMNFKITFPHEINPAFSVIFQYDEAHRTGKAIHFVYDVTGRMTAFLAELKHCRLKRISEEVSWDLRLCEDRFYGFLLEIQENQVSCNIDGHAFSFPCENKPGKLAIERANFIGELVMENFFFSSEDDFEAETVLNQTTVEIPCINGGDMPYRVTYQIDRVDGEYYMTASLDGGTKERVVNREERRGQYVAEKDWMTSPYVGIGSGKQDVFFQMAVGIHCFIDPNIYWDCQKEFFGDTDLPITNCYKLRHFVPEEDYELIFGYEHLECSGYFMQSGGHEFRFTKDGTLCYSGQSPDGRDFWEVLSPFDKFALSLLPEDCCNKAEAIEHLKYNHYFDVDESVELKLVLYTETEPSYLSLAGSIFNVYETEVLESRALTFKAEKWRRHYHKLTACGQFNKLPVGVYKIEFMVYYGEAEYQRIVKTFEVFDKASDACPPLESGLPFMFSMNNETKKLKRNGFDIWNPAHSCDMEHYMACATNTPVEAEELKVWKVLKPFKRKWFAWLAIRTCNDYLSEVHNETLENADYLFHTGRNTDYDELSTGSLFPNRMDHWTRSSYLPKPHREMLDMFLKDHPDVAERLSYKAGDDTFTEEQYQEMLKICGEEAMAYINAICCEMVTTHNRELEAMNPKVKRSIYGPMPTYSQPTVSYRSLRTFGVPDDSALCDEYYSGFAILEDYPYSCSYQTYRGAFAVMTLLLHIPRLTIYPEQYKGSRGGCIDGAVKFAHAPMGAYVAHAYQNSTHAFEFVFNTPHLLEDGYHYWNTYGFHRPDYKPAFMEQLILDWKYAITNKPKRPLRAMGFVADYSGDKDLETEWLDSEIAAAGFNNQSELGHAIVYECSRESGVPAGFAMKFDALERLTAAECDLLVLPSLKSAEPKHLAAIRKLYEAGVNLLAVSDVTGLEDIFGVCRQPMQSTVTRLTYEGESEYISRRLASFRYGAAGAEAVVCTGDGLPVLLCTERTALVNTSLTALGAGEASKRGEAKGSFIVGSLIRKALRVTVRALSRPLALGENVGVTLFETEKGESKLLAIDYTPFDNREQTEKQAVIKLNMPEVYKVSSERPVLAAKRAGAVCEIRFSVKPHEAVFIDLHTKA